MPLKPKSIKILTILLGLFTAFLIWLLAGFLTRTQTPVPVLAPPDGKYDDFKSRSEADIEALNAGRRAGLTQDQIKAVELYQAGLRELQGGNKAAAEASLKSAAALDPKNEDIQKALRSLGGK